MRCVNMLYYTRSLREHTKSPLYGAAGLSLWSEKTMSFFNYQGKEIFYSETGGGRPLMLLHGNTASSNMFQDAAADYSDRYRVILFDFLGYGRSGRVESFPADLWYDEARQVIAFLEEKAYRDVLLIGSSGGALAAVNAALERPDLIAGVVADSFEGIRASGERAAGLALGREQSKKDPGAVMFYRAMLGDDWQSVVDSDTAAVLEHAKTIGDYFHKPLGELKTPILLTGSREDPLLPQLETVYKEFIAQAGHGETELFERGGHPAMLSNREAFARRARAFFDGCR